MKKLKKKTIIIIACAILVIAAIAVAAVLLTKNSNESSTGEEGAVVSGTVVSISDSREKIADYIISWDSSEKEHTTSGNDVCAVVVGNVTTPFDNFEEAWIYVNTTEKNKDETLFVFYSDWVADENGNFGTGNSFIGGEGGLLIKGWTTKFTIDFNGYKLDRNLSGESVKNGSVIKVDESKNVYFTNGCITGGANTDDGAGVLIYGKSNVYFDNMTITGNVSGKNGGGIYLGTHAYLYLNNTDIEGNYAENFGGGVYCDYLKSGGVDKVKSVSGTVKIQNNVGSCLRNNLVLEVNFETSPVTAVIASAELSEGSAIYVSHTNYTNASKNYSGIIPVIRNNDNNSKYFNYFYADESIYEFDYLKTSVDNFYGINYSK